MFRDENSRRDIERVPELVERLYAVVDELESLFGRRFTPDGHLVGSLGEVLAAYLFDLRLNPPSTEGHDARWVPEAEGSTEGGEGVTVEIKCTQRGSVSFYSSDVEPDHIVVLRLNRGCAPDVVYNGPSDPVQEHMSKRAPQKNGQISITLAALRKLDEKVEHAHRLAYVRTFASWG